MVARISTKQRNEMKHKDSVSYKADKVLPMSKAILAYEDDDEAFQLLLQKSQKQNDVKKFCAKTAEETIESPSNEVCHLCIPSFHPADKCIIPSLPEKSRRSVDSTTGSFVSDTTTRSSRRGSGADSLNLSVSFGSVRVRRYGRALGDHPECRHGPALTLSWEYSDDEVAKDVEEYEQDALEESFLSLQRKARAGRLQPTNPLWRKNVLIFHAGVEERELKEAKKECDRIQKERWITRLFSRLWRVEFVLGSIKRKLKKRLRVKDSK